MKQSDATKAVLFVLTMALLLVFLARKQNGIIPVKPLYGVVQSEPAPQFSWESFRNSDYQESIERYFPELLGDSVPTARNPRINEVLAINKIMNLPPAGS